MPAHTARPCMQLEGDVFELLYTLGDFALFKDLIISYKPENRSGGTYNIALQLPHLPSERRKPCLILSEAFLDRGNPFGGLSVTPLECAGAAGAGAGAEGMVVSPSRPAADGKENLSEGL
eukprot:SAG11_NODE_1435_length_4914_cov_10.282866_5_plen_120_part_00